MGQLFCILYVWRELGKQRMLHGLFVSDSDKVIVPEA